MPYFWIYILVVLFSTSCNGVRPEFMPQYNSVLGELPKPAKEAYLELLGLLDGEDKVELKKQIDKIDKVKKLEDFIYKRLENQKKYNEVLKLLPRSDHIELKQKLAQCDTLHDREAVLNEYLMLFKMIQQVDALTKQHYIDLIALLSDDQATAFKNEVIQFDNPQKVVERIASKFCNVFGELKKEDKENLSKLKDRGRQDILREIMQSNDTKDSSGMHTGKDESSQAKSNNKPIDPNMSNDEHAAILKPDINKLIKQKVEDQQKQDEAIPQDEWGGKLSLIKEKKNRQEFLLLVMKFVEADQKILKELFNQVIPDSLEKFFSVFFTGFTNEERTDLLGAMIYLYRAKELITVKLCNAPKSVSKWEKFSLFLATTADQLKVLTKLDDLLNKNKSQS